MAMAIAVSSAAFGQTKMSKDKNNSVKAQIIRLENQSWEAWKNKTRDFVPKFLAEDAIFVYSEGVTNKTQIIKDFGSCDIKSYELSDYRFITLDKNSVLLSYTTVQDAVGGGKVQPSKVRSSSVFVKRGGKWLCTFYTETPAV